MKLTARNDQVMIKSQSKPNFASGKYGHWRKTASWEESEFRALKCHIEKKSGAAYVEPELGSSLLAILQSTDTLVSRMK